MEEAETERACRHAAEVELAKSQKELRRLQTRLADETARQASGSDETEEALQEAWRCVREECAQRQQAEERLEHVIEFLRSQGVDIPNLRDREWITQGDASGAEASSSASPRN